MVLNLEQLTFPFQSRQELFYQFSPALMQTNPKETVDAWIAQDCKLDPVQLIPALVQYDASKDPRQVAFVFRYFSDQFQMNKGLLKIIFFSLYQV